MATLYLVEQNSILRKQGNRLLLCKRPPAKRRYSAVLQSDIVLDLPCADVDHVMLFGNIQVTTSALHNLLSNGIELAIFSFRGELLGQLTPPMGKNLSLRIEQFRRFQDNRFTLQISRRIVQGKIANAQNFLREFLSNHPGIFSPAELAKFPELMAAAEKMDNLDTLRGIEGAAGAHYFSLFGRAISLPWQFKGRSKRPPGDPVNAVLSFGYVIVGSQIQALLDGLGLDPYLGLYHQPDYGRPSLALDLLEEFRHPLVDRLCTILFNKNILDESDFYRPATGGVYLSSSGKRKFFLHYENMLGKIAPDSLPETATAKGYFPVFQQQIQRLIRAIKENIPYQPYSIGN